MAPKGWYAKGLLQPLWTRYEGGRDALARAVGTSGPSLSIVNSGNRRLGHDLAGRLAAELGVSVLALGAPAEAAEVADRPFLDRLAEVEAGMNRIGPQVRALARDLDGLSRRVEALEKPARPKRARAGKKK